MFKWTSGSCQTLNHRLVIEGLTVADNPRPPYINLLIDREARTSEPSFPKPNLMNLRCFKGKGRDLNVIEEIGPMYMDFGVILLNDNGGNYMCGLEKEHRANSVAITTAVLTQWINGRQNAKEHSWMSLIETLKSIGLNRIAGEIEDQLREWDFHFLL